MISYMQFQTQPSYIVKLVLQFCELKCIEKSILFHVQSENETK